MIATKTFHLTKSKYYQIFFSKLKRNILQLLPFLLIFSLLLGWQMGRIIAITSILALIVIGFCLLIWFLFKNLKPFFSETQLQFDAHQFSITKNNSTSTWVYSKIRNVVSYDEYWLIYITINQYIYVPKHIFSSEEDLKNFTAYIHS